MADTKQPVSISLRLDNGDCIRASVDDRTARFVSFQQRKLSAEEESKQLDEIARIYQRLSETSAAQTKASARVGTSQSPQVFGDVNQASGIVPSLVEARAPGSISEPQPAKPRKPVQAMPPVQPAHSAQGGARTAPVAPPPRAKPSGIKNGTHPSVKSEPNAQAPSHRNAGRRITSATKRTIKGILDVVTKADTFGVFKLPVTKRVAPDYYQIVKNPMDLKTVRQNLDKGVYEDELAFKHDMDLIFYNCELYNGLTSEVGKHGAAVKKAWQKAWASNGLGDAPPVAAQRPPIRDSTTNKPLKRQPPSQASQPAPKAQRTAAPPPQLGSAQMSLQASSQAGMGPLARPPLQPSAQPNGRTLATMPRPHVPSMQSFAQPKGKFPEQRSSDLFEWIGESNEKAQDDVLSFLNSLGCNLQAGPDEEVELDPDALSDEVLWKLDEWCQKRSGGTYNPDKRAQKVSNQPVLSLAPADDEETDED